MRLLTTIYLWALVASAWSQSDPYWRIHQEDTRLPRSQHLLMSQLPSKYMLATLDLENLYQDWNAAYEANAAVPMQVSVPNPEGGFTEFMIVPTRVVAEEVAHLYQIATFKGYAVNSPNRLIRCDVSATGFHAWVFGDGRSYVVEPLSKADASLHIVYYKANMPHAGISCGVTDAHQKASLIPADGAPKTPTQLRTYRLAIIADASYRAQFGGMVYNPANVLAAFASGVNLLNGIYERDLGVHFMLVSNTACANAVLADHTDIDEVHYFLVNLSGLGVSGFDLGHSVLWMPLGGLAYVGVVCNNSYKGGGFSGINISVVTLWIDFVAHEVGHQFGAFHTFSSNPCGTSVSSFRFEPGEGSTIMAYAGACSDGYQFFSDPFFHSVSIAQINTFITSFGGCATLSMPGSGNSAAPVANANADITIPQQTPFILVGTGSDANGDPITYSWEQYDGMGGATTGPPNCSSTMHPMFRFRPPVVENYRVFPQYSDVLAGNNNTPAWEKLPCTPRTMNFRLITRDNNINWGRTHADNMMVTVANTGPFNVTYPNGAENWLVGSSQTVTWTVNGTSSHCANVDVLLSTDNGVSYTVLGTYPNSGSATITVPATPTTQARILVQCSVGGNFRTASTFFDVSDAAFSISTTFGVGNIVLLQADALSNNTTARIIEINTTTSMQSPISDIPIDGTGPSALRFSGSATSTGYLSNSDDRTLLLFTGHNNTNTSANVNTLNPRGVGTLDHSKTFNLATTYTGVSSNQTRCATSLDNTTMFIADQSGIYTNSSTSASPTGNFRGIKAFGGVVYVGQQSSSAPQVSTVSAPSMGTITGLPGISNSTSFQDFYLIQSGANGSTYDVLYITSATSATAGVISKFSLVSGTWTANGTYSTSFGGFGLAAQKSGSGAELYVSTGNGATSTNSVIKLTDNAGYNATISISTPSNVTLYTAPTGSNIKGVAFAPLPACPVLATAPDEVIINNSTCQPGCTVGGGSIAPPATGCPTGSTIQYSTDGGLTWSATIPTYNQTGPAQTIQTRCACDANPSVTSPTSAGVTTVPGVCTPPVAPSGMLAITNSTCQSGCTVGGGSIAIGSVTGTGTLEFSQDGGMTWSTSLPTYNQTGPAQTIIARVTDANGCTSGSTTVGTTSPGSCVTPGAPTLTITDNVCPSTTGTISATGCGTGTVVEYALSAMGPWSATPPAYTTSSFTVYARCRDTATDCVSTTVSGTTSPTACSSDCGSAYWNMTVAPVTTNTIPNVAAGDIGRGNNNGTTTLITTSSSSTGYTGASGGGNAGAAAFTGVLNTSTSTYFQVTITPNPGYVFTLNSMSFGMRSTGTGPQAYSIRTSLDGYATEVAGGTVPNNSAWNLYSHSSLSVASAAGTPITIRIYGYNGTGSPAVGVANWRIDDLTISGCATDACPVLTTAPGEVVITNSTCNPGCVTSGGNIAPPTIACPAGSSLQYSTDGGLTWSATIPTYNQTGPAQTIQTRCACDADPSVTSPTSVGVTTAPNACPIPTLTGTSPVCIGDSIQLTGSGSPAVTDPYVSSNTAVATVSNTGWVTGVSAGSTTITYTDLNGCTATFNVTVINCTPTCDVAIINVVSMAPSCPGGSDGTMTITATTSNPSLTYAISGPATGSNPTGAFTSLPAGMYSIVVTDGIGCTAITSLTVPAGTDTIPPSITCPSNQIQNVDAGTCTWTSPAGSLTPTVSDNCSVASVTWATVFPGPAPDVTIAGWDFENATKRSGGLPYTADTGIPANQNVAPLSVVGASYTAFVQGSGGMGTYAPNANDWTGSTDKYWQVVISTAGYNNLKFSSAQAGSGTSPRDFTVDYSLDGVTWTNVPGSNVTIGTATAPTFTGFLTNIALPAACDNQPTLYLRWRRTGTTSVNGSTIALAGTNRIDDIVVVGKPLSTGVNDISGTVFPLGITSVTYHVTDGSGNTNACTFTVTVNDNIAPTLTCPTTQTLPLSSSACDATLPDYTTLATASDNCGTATLMQSPAAGTTVSGVGPMTVTITATDGAGNTATCNFTVNKTAPSVSITCPANQMLTLGASCSATLPDYTGLVTATGCGTVTVTQVPAAGTTVTEVGPMTVTFTATDSGGNTAQCSVTVNKMDITPPTVMCNNTSIDFNGEPSITLSAALLVTASDNCGIASITLSPSVISCNQVGQTVPVIATVTDVNGNVSTCTADVTVGGFPCGWSYTPGLIGCDGSAAFNPATGIWTNTAVNCYYPNSFDADSKSFITRKLCGNGSITVKVESISGTTLGWAGIVMRDGTAPGAMKIQLMTNLSNLHRREVRYVTNGTAYPQQFPANNRYWLRLVRQGNQFMGFASPDGLAWFLVMTATINMPNCIEMGMVVTNYNPISNVTATFSNVSTTGSLTPLMAPAVANERLLDLAPEFDLYPNPTGGQLNLNLNQYIGRAVRIEVYSLEGKLVQFSEIDSVHMPVEIFELNSHTRGMYLVKVKSEGLPDAVKLVVLNR